MISVCMATYNGAQYLGEQVDSVLSQLQPQDELVVSDDGSTDRTVEILQSYNDPRIRIFCNERAHGVVGNFDTALSHAMGDYIFLCDQDDVWRPDKVAKCIEVLQRVDLVVHNAQLTTGYKIIRDSYFELRGSGPGYWKNLWRNSFVGCCMAFRREVLRKISPLPPKTAMHDMYIGLVASRKFTVEFLDETLVCYRRHGGNASATGEESSLSRSYQLAYRLRMFLQTITQ